MDMRRRHAIGVGMATALALASSEPAAASQTSNGPQAEPEDAWLDQGGRRHRMVFDTLSSTGLGQGMNFAKNFFEANRVAGNISPNELSVVLVIRHATTPLIFNDHIWNKYGEHFVDRTKLLDPRTKAPPRVNLYNVDLKNSDLPNGKVTLAELSKLGTRFAVCAVAAKNIATAVAKNVDGDADAILKEFEANLATNTALMVPAGILAVNRAQEHGYTFSYCG